MTIKKAQTSTEFVIMVSILIFFFTVMFLIINNNLSDKYRQKEQLAVKELAFTIQDELTLAASTSDGYIRTFKLPTKISNKEYEVTVVKGEVDAEGYLLQVKTERASIVVPIPPITYDGIPDDEVFNHEPGNQDNTIKKVNGEIYVNHEP